MKAFLSEFSRGMPSSAYVIYAENPDFDFLVREAYKKIKNQFGGDEGFRFTSYDFGNIENPENPPTIHAVLDDANALSFLSKRKAVIVENFQLLLKERKGDKKSIDEEAIDNANEIIATSGKSRKKEILSLINKYVENPSPSTLLVFLWHGKIPSQFINKVKLLDVSMRRSEVKEWCKRLARDRGFDLTEDALEFIFWACGGDDRTAGDVGIIYTEIDKLSLLLDPEKKGKTFDINDLKDIVSIDADANAFRLGEAMLKGNKGEAFSILYTLDTKGEVAQKTIGGLNYIFGKRTPNIDVAEILHKADIGVKTGNPDALYQLVTDYFQQMDRRLKLKEE